MAVASWADVFILCRSGLDDFLLDCEIDTARAVNAHVWAQWEHFYILHSPPWTVSSDVSPSVGGIRRITFQASPRGDDSSSDFEE